MKILILILSSSVFANSIGISPSQINFSGNANEKICNNITIFGDGSFLGEDKWSIIKTRNMGNYVLDAEYFGIKMYYLKDLNLTEKENVEICVVSKNEGVFYGSIFYGQNYAAVGSWIVVQIESYDNFLTGSVVNSSLEDTNLSLKIIGIFVLATILFFLVIDNYLKKRS